MTIAPHPPGIPPARIHHALLGTDTGYPWLSAAEAAGASLLRTDEGGSSA